MNQQLLKPPRTGRLISGELYHQESDKGGKGVGNSLPGPSIDDIHDQASYKIGVQATSAALGGFILGNAAGSGVCYSIAVISSTATECGPCHLLGD